MAGFSWFKLSLILQQDLSTQRQDRLFFLYVRSMYQQRIGTLGSLILRGSVDSSWYNWLLWPSLPTQVIVHFKELVSMATS